MKAQSRVKKGLLLYIAVCLMNIMAISHCANAYELTWTGCGITKKAFMEEIALAYKKKTGNSVKISGGGATKGIRAVSAGTSDSGGTCRHWLGGPDNKDPREANAKLVQVAWDALVVIVHQDNPVNNITLKQLRDIYDGTLTSWNSFGWDDKKIALVTRSGDDSGVGHMFRLLVFGNPQYQFKARSYVFKSTGPLEKKIVGTVTALGIDGISSAKKTKVKVLSLNGIAPTKTNIASGKYPLFRPLYVVINKAADPRVQDLIAFMLSPEGQMIIANQGAVNLAEGKALEPLWQDKAKHFKE